eukprot:TRINITY_DN1013_c0_g1_i11.p2 TRINITY_DN1013_c0_g1~~TRINITY_DN1013_c0_g1_i11.p2  ORF type:complete len:106 (+),score=15.72 TRINITY_DN1013_c0_g1_i11:271-588(+)
MNFPSSHFPSLQFPTGFAMPRRFTITAFGANPHQPLANKRTAEATRGNPMLKTATVLNDTGSGINVNTRNNEKNANQGKLVIHGDTGPRAIGSNGKILIKDINRG